jgi:hypothetical protein
MSDALPLLERLAMAWQIVRGKNAEKRRRAELTNELPAPTDAEIRDWKSFEHGRFLNARLQRAARQRLEARTVRWSHDPDYRWRSWKDW